MHKTKHHKRTIKNRKNRKNGINYDDHAVVFASDMNFWKYVLKRTKQVVLIIDDKKLPKKVKKQLGGSGIGYEKIYVIAYPSLLDPSKILYKNIIFDANSYGAIDGFKHYIDSSVLDVEEYLASIKKSYETFKFLPREARIKEILVGNSDVFPKLEMRTVGDSDKYMMSNNTNVITHDEQTTNIETSDSSPNISPNVSALTMETTPFTMSSYTGPTQGKDTSVDVGNSNGTRGTDGADGSRGTDGTDGTDGTRNNMHAGPNPYPYGQQDTIPPPGTQEENKNAKPDTKCTDKDISKTGPCIKDKKDKICVKEHIDDKTKLCKEPDSTVKDNTGIDCKLKNIDPETKRCNIVKTKDGKLCHTKNINTKTGNCDKELDDKRETDKDNKHVKYEVKKQTTFTDKSGKKIIKDKKGNIINITDKYGKEIDLKKIEEKKKAAKAKKEEQEKKDEVIKNQHEASLRQHKEAVAQQYEASLRQREDEEYHVKTRSKIRPTTYNGGQKSRKTRKMRK